MTVATQPQDVQLQPQWVAPVWELREGRDPLGMQTTTTDRLLPVLLPGLIEQSQQARYFSFYAFLLAEYERRKLGWSRAELDRFVRRAEWDYGLAVIMCERCDTSPQGALRLRPVIAQHSESYPRGESVQSTLGGYGLYYRTPMNQLGLIAREGSMLGDEPIPIDVLADSDRAKNLAATFSSTIVDTAYNQQGWIVRTEPLPQAVVEEYGKVACLCRLDEFPDERDAIHEALFGRDPERTTSVTGRGAGDAATKAGAGVLSSDNTTDFDRPASSPERVVDAVTQRCRSVAHFLTLIEDDPQVVDSQSVYRQALWNSSGSRSDAHRRIAGEWAGLVVKDVWQEALCSVWTSFCRDGVASSRELGRPLEPIEVEQVARGMAADPPLLKPQHATAMLLDQLTAGQLRVTVPADVAAQDHGSAKYAEVDPSKLTMEQMRNAAVALDSATFGLIVLLEVVRRVRERSGPGWADAIRVRSNWQPSVAEVAVSLEQHLTESPTIAGTLWWITRRFVIDVHERIAYSKLPQRMFTFRFRWDDARLRFYDHGIERFPLAAARHTPFVKLTQALGLWDRSGYDGRVGLTERGRAFVESSLSS